MREFHMFRHISLENGTFKRFFKRIFKRIFKRFFNAIESPPWTPKTEEISVFSLLVMVNDTTTPRPPHTGRHTTHFAEGRAERPVDGEEDGGPHGAVLHLATHVAIIEGVTGIQK